MATVTIELDQITVTILETQATMQGLSVAAWLRKLAENNNGAENHLPNASSDNASAQEPEEQETIGERLARKGLIGMIDSSLPRPDSPPNKSDYGELLAEKFRQQGLIIPS